MQKPIKIVKCIETVDNWGNTETYKNEELFNLLSNPADEWTDDQVFLDEGGRKYLIDDLIGKEVEVNGKVFTVVEY